MLRVDMLNELGNDFSVGLRFKLVSLVFQKLLDVLVVGDDSCYFNFITNVNLKNKNTKMQFLTRVPLWTTMNSLLSSERWG